MILVDTVVWIRHVQKPNDSRVWSSMVGRS